MTNSEAWRNRIIGEGEESPDQLLANPANWRVHGKAQQDALEGVLNEVGWVDRVIVNQRTGHLVDGHLRVTLALRRGEPSIPVHYVDLSESEESLVLATLDPIAAMATADRAQLAALLEDVQTGEAGVQAMLVDLAEREKIAIGEPGNTDGELIENTDADGNADMPPLADYVFETDNEYGIPVLDPTMQATALVAPVLRYGQKTRHAPGVNVGTLHFYTEDYKFNAIWRDPLPRILTGAQCIIEPNYSTNQIMPTAVALYGIFKKHWLARYWQKCGIRIIVDLNIEPRFEELNLIGVPVGWGAYATRYYHALGEPELERQYALATLHAGTNDVLFVVVGGGESGESACRRHHWTFVPQENHVIEKERKNGER